MTSLFSSSPKEGSIWATKVHPAEFDPEKKPYEEFEDEDDDDDDGVGFKKELKQFGDSVTLHGFRFLTNYKLHFLRRFIWFICVTGMFIYLTYEIVHSLHRYYSRPISTVITMNYVSNITFPAVTLCNYNNFKSSLVTPYQARLVSSIFTINPEDRIPVDWVAYEKAVGRPLDVYGFAVGTAHRIEDMLRKCSWRSTMKCGPEDFKQIITDWGVCYTYNHDPETALQVRRPGSSNGLSMILNIEQDEYTYGENTGAGLKVLLHVPGQFPLVKELGFSVSPGFETDVSVQYNSVTNLKDPYPSNCSDKQLKYSEQYSVSLCRYECKVDYVTSVCGCKDVRYQGVEHRVCLPQEQIDCVYPAEANFTALDIHCDCEVSCKTFIYNTRISTAYWPAVHTQAEMAADYNITEEFARKNLVHLKIYFEELSYQEIQQTPAYEASSLQSEVGGYMGLLCGMSVLTIGELIDFILTTIYKKFFRTQPETPTATGTGE